MIEKTKAQRNTRKTADAARSLTRRTILKGAAAGVALSALDLKLRQHMRTELRAIQKRVGITFIYIAHDQGEALTTSDRVAVMSEGVIDQVSDSSAIYDHPETAFVASFVGESNPFFGKVKEVSGDTAQVKTGSGRLRGRALRTPRTGFTKTGPGYRPGPLPFDHFSNL